MKVISILLSILINFGSLVASFWLFDKLKGRNYSDVGVPMYENKNTAMLLGYIFYILLIFLAVFIQKKYLLSFSFTTQMILFIACSLLYLFFTKIF